MLYIAGVLIVVAILALIFWGAKQMYEAPEFREETHGNVKYRYPGDRK